jgi:outer membrane murein-binding lipoprotein Lpp
MAKFKKMFLALLIVTMFSGSVLIVGCGGGVSEEEMKQLNDLKAEVEKLQGDVNKLESEKADLQKQIAKQDEMVKNYQKMTDAVKNCK